MISTKSTLFGIGIVLLLILVSGCLAPVEEPNASTIQTAPDFQEVNASDEEQHHIEAVGSMSSEYKENKHDMKCTVCHTERIIKPKCTDCHEPVHGTQLRNCTECHDAHNPMSNISSPRLGQFCSYCHPQQFEEFSTHHGRHADLKCVYCHKVHGQIETCTNCHAPHSTELRYEDCLNCHPAHVPQEVEYPATIPNEQCAVCHERTNTELVQGNTKHSSLNCAYCHTTHKQIPECMDCHTPHTQDMTYDDCIGCHPAHNPMAIKFSVDTPREDCAACHREIDAELRGSNTKHNDLGCVYCHPEHRYLPTCESCHGLPHKNIYNVHEDYPDCSQCHIAPHEVNNIVFTRE
ncbi:MAG: hypothetical protein U9N07_05980 [Euryarchaeota archaeon]|nr:hypothetical protein [Euryarchaeota archaeon]